MLHQDGDGETKGGRDNSLLRGPAAKYAVGSSKDMDAHVAAPPKPRTPPLHPLVVAHAPPSVLAQHAAGRWSHVSGLCDAEAPADAWHARLCLLGSRVDTDACGVPADPRVSDWRTLAARVTAGPVDDGATVQEVCAVVQKALEEADTRVQRHCTPGLPGSPAHSYAVTIHVSSQSGRASQGTLRSAPGGVAHAVT